MHEKLRKLDTAGHWERLCLNILAGFEVGLLYVGARFYEAANDGGTHSIVDGYGTSSEWYWIQTQESLHIVKDGLCGPTGLDLHRWNCLAWKSNSSAATLKIRFQNRSHSRSIQLWFRRTKISCKSKLRPRTRDYAHPQLWTPPRKSLGDC